MKWKMIDELIDTSLLVQMRNMILELTDKKDAYIQFNQIIHWTLYEERPEVEGMETMYGLRYPGEVLERYAEKIGDSPKIIRTLAMAVSEMKPLLSKSMFVGNQYVRFLQTIRKNSKADLYCKGSLFLLEENPEKKAEYRKALWKYEWKDIMELLYLMSVFPEDGWEKWGNELIRLLGKERTIEVYGNQGLYIWIINHYARKVKECRKKDMNLFKAVCRLPLVNAEGMNPVKKWMIEAGYSEEEICFLNLGVLFGAELPNRIVHSSITAERMALNACLHFLGSEKEYPQEVYELCTTLLKMHNSYEIKLEGVAGIFGSLRNKGFTVRSVGAYRTLLPFSSQSDVSEQYFWIDLLDQKWDCLQKLLEREEYRKKVIETLAEKPYAPELLETCVKRYEELTGEALAQCFWITEEYSGRVLFSKMAENGMIDAVSLGRQYLRDYRELTEKEWKEKWAKMLGNMRSYIFTLKNKESYEVFNELISEFGIRQVDHILQNSGTMRDIFGLDSYGWRYDEIHIVRAYLNESQNRKLFQWAEQYVYEEYSAHYTDFLYAVLVSNEERGVLDHDTASSAAKYMLDNEDNLGYKAQRLRNLYLTEKELTEYENQIRAREEDERKKEEMRIDEETQGEFQKFLEEKGEDALKELSKFLYFKHGYRKQSALEVSTAYLRTCCSKKEIHTTVDGVSKILKLFAELYEEKVLGLEELKQYTNELEVA